MTYHYTGHDAGIPGLPHVISDEEADAQGLRPLLDDAIAAGVYAPIDQEPPAPKRGKKNQEVTND